MSFSETQHDAPVEAPMYGVYLAPNRQIIHSSQSMPATTSAVARELKNVRAETKRLFTKEQPLKANAKKQQKLQEQAKGIRPMSEFMKLTKKGVASPSPVRLSQSQSIQKSSTMKTTTTTKTKTLVLDENTVEPDIFASELSVEEIAYAALAVSRVIEGSSSRVSACGNSPFCRKNNHGHESDKTELGLLESKIRNSADYRDTIGSHVVPAYPFNSFESGLVKQKTTNNTAKHHMSNRTFSDGLKRDDLATAVLAHWRIYFLEFANIGATFSKKREQIEVDRLKHQSEANAVVDRPELFVQLDSVNAYYDEMRDAIGGEGVAAFRLLQLTSSQQLKHLLQRHNVPKLNVVHAALYEMMMSKSDYSDHDEHEILNQIRVKIEQLSAQEGAVDSEYSNFDVPEWRPIYDKLQKEADEEAAAAATIGVQRRATTTTTTANDNKRRRTDDTETGREPLIDLTKFDDDDDVDDKRLMREHDEERKRQEFLEMTNGLRQSTDLFGSFKVVCGSQFTFAKDCNACTSICVNVAATLAQAASKCVEMNVSELCYVTSIVSWAHLVENGVTYWLERMDKKFVQEHIFDIMKEGERADAIREHFVTAEYSGSMFSRKITPVTAEEIDFFLAKPDLESAFEMFREHTEKSFPLSYILTFHNHSIALSEHNYGWHVFDSYGGVIANRSVLYTVQTVKDALEVVRSLFKVNEIDQNDPGDRTMDEHHSYSMVGFALKKKNEQQQQQ